MSKRNRSAKGNTEAQAPQAGEQQTGEQQQQENPLPGQESPQPTVTTKRSRKKAAAPEAGQEDPGDKLKGATTDPVTGVDSTPHNPSGKDPMARTDPKEWGTEAHGEKFLMMRLLTILKKRVMGMVVAPQKLSEQEQSHFLRSVHADLKDAVKQTIQVIAANGRITFRAEVPQVVFKGPTDVTASIKLVPGPHAHAMADQSGGHITIIIEDTDPLLEVNEDILKGEPDTRPLFDESSGGRAGPANGKTDSPTEAFVATADTPQSPFKTSAHVEGAQAEAEAREEDRMAGEESQRQEEGQQQQEGTQP